MIHRVWSCAILLGVCACISSASTFVFYNQSQWQAAMTAQGTPPLANVSFASSDWTSSFQSSRNFNSLTSLSTTAAGNGMSISAVSGYSPLGVANDALLGQASNGLWTDTISKYGTTTFNFSNSIYGFGGDFDIFGANGLDIFSGGTQFNTPNGAYDGFVGVISDQSMSSIMITWGQNASCPQCFGNSYTLGNFQLATDPIQTPEPNFKYAVAGLLVFGIAAAIFKRS